jgi:hypothetical protein
MSRRRVFLSALVLLLSTARYAGAQTIGPYCFQPQPFADVFAMYLTTSGPGQFSATGTNLLTGSSVHGLALIRGAAVQVSFEAIIPPTGSAHTFLGSADLSLFSLAGPGRCETVNTSGGCGLGTAITLRLVACPAGVDEGPDLRRNGRGGGGGGER